MSVGQDLGQGTAGWLVCFMGYQQRPLSGIHLVGKDKTASLPCLTPVQGLPAGWAQHHSTRVTKQPTWPLRAPREWIPRGLAHSLKASYESAFKRERICSHL